MSMFFMVTLMFLLLSGARAQTILSVTDLGARPDRTNATATTAAFRSAFTTNSTGQIRVPPGQYLIDNSGGAFAIANFSGELRFEGNAQLVFTNNNLGGLIFVGGSGARIYGLK